MSYDNLSCVFQNVLKFYQQLTGEERRIPFIFDDFHFCRSRLIVFAPFLLIIIIKSPKQSLGDLLFLLRFLLLLSLPNKVWETYCFCSVSYYYFYYYHSYSSSPFFPRTMNLSTADLRNYWTKFHETWWSYRYMFLVGPKIFSFVVKGVKVIF